MADHDVYVNLNLRGNELKRARWQVLPEPPDNPAYGQHYFDSTLGRPLYWDGIIWVDSLALIQGQSTPRTAFFDDQTGTSLNLPFPAATLPAQNERIRVYVEGVRLFPDQPGNPPRALHWYREQGNLNDLFFHRPFTHEWVMVEII